MAPQPIHDDEVQLERFTPTTPALYTQEEIEARAYELWEQRGRPEGSPEVDWFAAETQLLGE